MDQKSRVERIADRLKGVFGLNQETSPKGDLSVVAESVVPKDASLSELTYTPESAITARMARSEGVEKYRGLS
jgi:hypothetical protein